MDYVIIGLGSGLEWVNVNKESFIRRRIKTSISIK